MTKGDRYWEIDAVRGGAVVMMVISNFVFDLFFFSGFDISLGGFWGLFARVTAGTFLFLVGLSLTISRNRQDHRSSSFRKYLSRGLFLIGVGMLISLVTKVVAGNQYVRFGILHLIGVSIILTYPLATKKWRNLFAGGVLVVLGMARGGIQADHPWLLWLGIEYPGYRSVDYTPLVPWLSPVLFGIFAGHLLYPGGMRRFSPPALESLLLVRSLGWLGNHSLIVYLLHQPVLLGILSIAG